MVWLNNGKATCLNKENNIASKKIENNIVRDVLIINAEDFISIIRHLKLLQKL